ncbi:alkane 1-monooxygenase [Litoribrevibacter euphylliae]|uniref:Alkane 1-monooxygenase n=1 Tax=Litoribrevibacter euphylliae TaxID=1834034 RepID=A0ABV7HQ41_9GAMM
MSEINNTEKNNADNNPKDKSYWATVKKYWYLVTFVAPAALLVTALLAAITGQGAWLWGFTAIFFVIIPIVDTIVGEDPYNPSKEEETELSTNDNYYKNILYLATAAQWAGLITMTYVVTQYSWAWYDILGAVLSVGALHAVGLTISHELGHKVRDKHQTLAAKICSACSGYAHFNIEHNKGHHKHVATPEDPASSRMGESLYKFALREIPGAAQRGWKLEADRLKRLNKSFFSKDNELLQTLAITFVAYGLMTAAFGWMALPFLLLTAAYGWFQLTMANYIEHYGLLRQKNEDGRYERCQPKHSWNNNFKATNLITLHLQRHSDHHAHPTRAYQILRDYPEAPQLPHGYPAMMALSMVPPLWKMVMDPRVVEWAKGDMSLVNMDSASKSRMFQKYHKPQHAIAS